MNENIKSDDIKFLTDDNNNQIDFINNTNNNINNNDNIVCSSDNDQINYNNTFINESNKDNLIEGVFPKLNPVLLNKLEIPIKSISIKKLSSFKNLNFFFNRNVWNLSFSK